MRRVLITGASRGIGKAVALRLASPGTELVLQGRDADALEDVAAAVRSAGAAAAVHRCDLADPAKVELLAYGVAQGGLHALVHNAGVTAVAPLEEIAVEEWHRCLAVNVTAPFILTRRLAPLLPRGGTIVSLLSVAVQTAFPGWGAYTASKAALEGMTRVLREELRERGVRVVNVYPSATDTALWDDVPGTWPRQRMLAAREVAEAVAFALERPAEVVVDEMHLGNVAGAL